MTLYDQWQAEHHGDFAAGVDLLQRSARPKLLISSHILEHLYMLRSMGRQPDGYYAGKLADALRKLPPLAGPAKTDLVFTTSTQPVQVGKTATIRIEAPANQIPVPMLEVVSTPETRALHKRHSYHHALMVGAKTDEERAEHAAIIMDEILPELDRLYDLQRSGGATPSTTIVTGKSADLRLQLASVRTRISTLKKKIPEARDARRKADLETQLQEKEAERARLENLLA